MWSKDPSRLTPYDYQKDERWNRVKQQLSNIWHSSSQCAPENQAAIFSLNRALSDFVSRLENEGVAYPDSSSPNGQYYIVTFGNSMVLMTVCGYLMLEDDMSLGEGESWIKNVYWMESDHIVIYDYVHLFSTICTLICHYSYDQNAFLCRMERKNQLPD